MWPERITNTWWILLLNRPTTTPATASSLPSNWSLRNISRYQYFQRKEETAGCVKLHGALLMERQVKEVSVSFKRESFLQLYEKYHYITTMGGKYPKAGRGELPCPKIALFFLLDMGWGEVSARLSLTWVGCAHWFVSCEVMIKYVSVASVEGWNMSVEMKADRWQPFCSIRKYQTHSVKCTPVLAGLCEHYRTVWQKVMTFGTQIEDSININHSKFGVSISNNAPPPVNFCTFLLLT